MNVNQNHALMIADLRAAIRALLDAMPITHLHTAAMSAAIKQAAQALEKSK